MKEQQASFHVPDINRVFLREKKGAAISKPTLYSGGTRRRPRIQLKW